MSDNYTGFRTIETDKDKINQLYKDNFVDIWDRRLAWYPNMYVELIDIANPQHTGLAKVQDDKLVRINTKLNAEGIKPRNREQLFALDALLDDRIRLVVLTGGMGSGKTLLALAAALTLQSTQEYNKLILSKPMTQIGKHKLGTLPGEIEGKFHPYLINYESNFQQILGKHISFDDVIDQYNVEFRPVQLFLGASFIDTCFLLDEAQNLTNGEMGSLLTRAGDNCKVIVMGDYIQNHDQISIKDQGLRRLVNDPKAKASSLIAVIELQKCERSELASVIGEIFGG